MTTNTSSPGRPAIPPDGDGVDPLDAVLRASVPPALPDDGFTSRAMRAVALADPSRPPAVRATPRAIAQALALEQRAYAAQQRLWRWGMAGVVAGGGLLAVAMLLSPADVASPVSNLPSLRQWASLWALLLAGALWTAWREFRAA